MGLSRLEPADFNNFLAATTLFTGFVRIKQEVALAAAAPPAAAAAAEAAAVVVAVAEVEGVAEVVASPFACIGATMGWETFHLVHSLWLSQLDVPAKSDTKDWALQVGGEGG